MKTLPINNFTTKLLSKLLSDLYIEVHSKGSKNFGSRQFFHCFSYENIVYNQLYYQTRLLFKLTPIERSLRNLLKTLIAKSLIFNIFIERLGFTVLIYIL